MGSPVEERTRHFYRWERRGRGRTRYPYPVALEPPFTPFRYFTRSAPPVDDGRHHTLFSSLRERLVGGCAALSAPAEEIEEAAPEPHDDDSPLLELAILPGSDLAATPALTLAWLKGLSLLQSPVSFELVGEGGRVSVLLSCRAQDAPLVSSNLHAFFPQVEAQADEALLLNLWEDGEHGVFSAIEFGLGRECMVPLGSVKSFSPDPLTPVAAALADTAPGELALVQVVFAGVSAPWAQSIAASVVTPSGEPFFADAPEITALAREKISNPLCAVVMRVLARAASEERVWMLLRGIGTALGASLDGQNELVPLAGGELGDLLGDVLLRSTHRPGFLLSLPELATLVHLPTESVPAIVRETARTKAAPAEAAGDGVLLGYNVHRGARHEVRLAPAARMRHVHVVGASGTGKSTLLVSLILDDIDAGHGVGVIDPHGDLIDEVLGRLPQHRAEDVILFDPADPDYVVGWNLLTAHSEAEKEMLASDLCAVFRRLSTSWGDQMTAVLSNAILSFLESERGGTLLDLRHFLVDPGFRKSFMESIRDPLVREFWTVQFPMLSGKPTGPIFTRLDTFLRGRLLRGVMTATEKPLDFRGLLDDGRIFLGKLSQGAIGEENAALLGSLLVSKFHQVALLRQDQAEATRRPFYLYLDEFHNVATPSMAALFSGARKYRLGLTVAHQELYQLHSKVPDVERALLGNAYTRICFRLGDEDARSLSQGFSFFTADDLGNLETGETICRVGRKEQDFTLTTMPLPALEAEEGAERRRVMRELSLARWGVRRHEDVVAPTTPPQGETPKERVSAPAVPLAQARPETQPPPQPSEPTAPLPEPRRPGKGGPEHTYLQELVKRWAEERGFRAVIEEQIPGGGRVDVALHRDETRIACEVSVTTPLAYEVENVRKCLTAGFQTVAVVSLKRARLDKLEKLLAAALLPEEQGRVHLFTPEELMDWLSGQLVREEESVVAGYKVKVRYQKPDPRSKRIAEILARSMSRLKKDP